MRSSAAWGSRLRLRRTFLLCCAGAWALGSAPAAAQDPAAAARDGGAAAARGAAGVALANLPAPCDGRMISEIVVRTRAPFPEGWLRRWRWLSDLGQRTHTTTRVAHVRRFLALQPGQPCVELRRSESERILRAQPYLADASVRAVPDESGGVRIEVETVDEYSAIIGLQIGSETPFLTAVRLGDANLFGHGVYMSGEWRDGAALRDAYALRAIDYQFLGRPYRAEVQAARRLLGGNWGVQLSHPFFTDLQRVAWRVTTLAGHEYVGFTRPAGEPPALRVRRHFGEIGGVVRIGLPGRLSVFGASFSSAMQGTDDAPVLVSRTFGLRPDTTTAILGRYPARYHSVRVNALWGVRNVEYRTVAGFDALTATQDLRRGFQFGVLFGRSLAVLGSGEDDIFVAADLYAGNGSDRVFAGVQLQAEGRQNYDRNRWDGVVGSGRAAAYVKPLERHTLITSLEWSGGWRARVPFQLLLGDVDGGVRGFAASHRVGGRRGVLRVEDRWYLGRPRDAADFGVALFADAGRLWGGDVPYGIDTRRQVGVGVGLLGAIPPRSKRLWRVDLAFPLTRDPDARFELRLSNRDNTGQFWREPADVRRGREAPLAPSVFSWP